MISVEGLTKSYGDLLLFDDVAFKVNPGERVGLVGRNGHGKTTLFRIIMGVESPDAGRIGVPKNYRIGYVTQNIDFRAHTVLSEGMRGLAPDASGEHWKVEKILFGLGFTALDMQRSPLEFSGGYQVRLNLAKVLVSEPDMLLLDEPTNYLDITSIRWIKGFLRSWPREVFLITHDRSFMDDVVTHVLGIQRRKTKKVRGNTEAYYARIAQEEEIHEKTRLKNERRQKEMERFISRFRAKARLANLVQSRIKQLDKLKTHEKLEGFKNLDFKFLQKPFNGKYVLEAKHLAFAYSREDPLLIDDFSLTIGPRDRICIIGKNGAGKTTLLRLLAGDLEPVRGTISRQPNVAAGIFEQTNINTLVPERTIEEEIGCTNPELDRQAVRNICGAMMFSGDAALKKISVLSGGEKCRVMLGKLLGTPVNFLLLDEPTNHFDLESTDALLAAVDAFDGAVVMVTHNEMFLHALAERLIVFQEDGISVFEGGYQRFLETVGWETEAAEGGENQKPAESSDESDKAGPVDPSMDKKTFRRLRSTIIAERGSALKPLEDRIAGLEEAIVNAEARLEALNEQMQAASNNGDSAKIVELSREINKCQRRIDEDFETLESVTAEADQKRAEFDGRLTELESRKPF
ncbi:MAG: ABC-F family ATP-binding cassette domain-containing protein [Desulfobacterales bacterium]|nr:ABC-F family ATP-binding cassette domain-containing protein [Desulfobacterales bacterium]